MSLSELRSRNVDRVVETALESFIKIGIERTRVIDVAAKADLTERSIYRYFATKTDLVRASLILCWTQNVSKVRGRWEEIESTYEKGSDRVFEILMTYAELFVNSKNLLVFVQEAEVYLYRHNLNGSIPGIPVATDNFVDIPLAKAIEKGLEDGSIAPTEALPFFLPNAFDGLLGLLQKMAHSTYYERSDAETVHRRLESFCRALISQIEAM